MQPIVLQSNMYMQIMPVECTDTPSICFQRHRVSISNPPHSPLHSIQPLINTGTFLGTGLSTGADAAIVAGAVVVILVILCVCYCLCSAACPPPHRYSRRRKRSSMNPLMIPIDQSYIPQQAGVIPQPYVQYPPYMQPSITPQHMQPPPPISFQQEQMNHQSYIPYLPPPPAPAPAPAAISAQPPPIPPRPKHPILHPIVSQTSADAGAGADSAAAVVPPSVPHKPMTPPPTKQQETTGEPPTLADIVARQSHPSPPPVATQLAVPPALRHKKYTGVPLPQARRGFVYAGEQEEEEEEEEGDAAVNEEKESVPTSELGVAPPGTRTVHGEDQPRTLANWTRDSN
jgi:hypothetical protein